MLTKVCTKCGVEKTIDCFYNHQTGKHGVASTCKNCKSKYGKQHYYENRDHILHQQKEHHSLNKESIASQTKKYREQNYQTIALVKKQWSKDNSDKRNANQAFRKSVKLQATPSWSDKKAINGMYRLATLFNSTGINLHVDHIIPLQSDTVCGLHCEANLQLLPASDNTSKGNRWWPDMW